MCGRQMRYNYGFHLLFLNIMLINLGSMFNIFVYIICVIRCITICFRFRISRVLKSVLVDSK